jgi:hypothetical protein
MLQLAQRWWAQQYYTRQAEGVVVVAAAVQPQLLIMIMLGISSTVKDGWCGCVAECKRGNLQI